jgi:hypothetical protein
MKMHKYGDITTYTHHGMTMAVHRDLKGTHREHCLCFECGVFKPGQDDNCLTARMLYALCQTQGLVTPVFECCNFADGPADLSGLPGQPDRDGRFEYICQHCRSAVHVPQPNRDQRFVYCPVCEGENRL